ncbi:MAG: HAD-IIB family hydrolase [Firmicutes bacterium]|nr:HAD-IIB family hydrolase [Bacillota bacterium]
MKILASDFDKTLYIDDTNKLKMNIESIKKFISNGNIFCIITGRNYSDLKLLLNKYNIPYSYLICQDGAKIYNNVDYCINTISLDSDIVKRLMEVLDNKNCDYFLDDGYNETTNINDCVKIAIKYNDKEKAEELLNEIKSKFDLYIYLSTEHINIVNSEVNKSNSIKKLLELENLNKNDVYVIGDEVNDLEMLKHFKGAIMKNHGEVLDNINKDEYEYLYEYIEELSKN